MAYRNGTYIAFHANGTDIPIDSDIKYYNLLKAWSAKGDDDFAMINSHDKASSVRDSSKKATLQASLQERLRNSKNMVLILGETTRFDTDWVPFEIEKAIDTYDIPLIVAYTTWDRRILSPKFLANYWPQALRLRIEEGTAKAIHIPFKKGPLMDAIETITIRDQPPHGLWFYSAAAYDQWQID